MPRCQRTFRRLPDTRPSGTGAEVGPPGCWTCPHCPEARETYEVVRDPDLLQYARLAEDAACAEFGRPGDFARPVLLLYGLRPECVLEPGDRRYEIYLQRDSDPLQFRLQIGHEMFHRVCSQGRIFHWTHEMLACLFSVRLLRRQGFTEYAAQMACQYRAEAEGFPLHGLCAADLWTMAVYPEGFYGRAYVTGCALEAAAGWPALCRLARAPGGAAPNIAAWLAGLPAERREAARDALAPASTPAAGDRLPEPASPVGAKWP